MAAFHPWPLPILPASTHARPLRTSTSTSQTRASTSPQRARSTSQPSLWKVLGAALAVAAVVEALSQLHQLATLPPTAVQAAHHQHHRHHPTAVQAQVPAPRHNSQPQLRTTASTLKHQTQARAQAARALALVTQAQALADHQREASSPQVPAVLPPLSSPLPFQSQQAHHRQEALPLLHHQQPAARKASAALARSHAQHKVSTASAPHSSVCATGAAQSHRTCPEALSVALVWSKLLLFQHSEGEGRHATFMLVSTST